METSNKQEHRILRFLAGAFFALGIGFVTIGATDHLSAQITTTKGYTSARMRSGRGSQITRTIVLHGAPSSQMTFAQSQAERSLVLGMLLVLTGFLFYALYVVRKQREEMHRSLWRRIVRWFQMHLDFNWSDHLSEGHHLFR